jgi:hypothetical protein
MRARNPVAPEFSNFEFSGVAELFGIVGVSCVVSFQSSQVGKIYTLRSKQSARNSGGKIQTLSRLPGEVWVENAQHRLSQSH